MRIRDLINALEEVAREHGDDDEVWIHDTDAPGISRVGGVERSRDPGIVDVTVIYGAHESLDEQETARTSNGSWPSTT